MRRGFYFLCVCALSMLIFSEYEKNNLQNGNGKSVETAATGSAVETAEPAAGKVAYLSFSGAPPPSSSWEMR